MEKKSEKYEKVLNILRKSKPVLGSTEGIEREVIKRLSKSSNHRIVFSAIVDFLFGWVYVSWVRRSLITASVVMVLIFIYQQGVILKQINYLSNQTIVNGGVNILAPDNEIEKRLLMYRIKGSTIPSKNITISEKQLEQLLESVDEVQDKYKDLLNIIEGDPELKKLFEDKLDELKRTKVKL